MRTDVRERAGMGVRPAWRVMRAAVVSVLVLAGTGAQAQDAAPPPPTESGPEALVPSTEETVPAETTEETGAAPAEPAAEEAPETEASEPEGEAAPEAAAMAVAAAAASEDPVTQQLSLPVLANEPPPVAFNGSYTTEVPLAVPAFRGLEPALSLIYESSQGQKAGGLYAGFVGTGWRLAGIPDIVRASRVKGTPSFDTTELMQTSDVFLLDGQELVRCTEPGASVAASCRAGGTHTTRSESYRKIVQTGGIWRVYAPDGILSTFLPVGSHAPGLPESQTKWRHRWLLTQVADTRGNTVDYSYSCHQAPVCFPGSIRYNRVLVNFGWSQPPAGSWLTRATGENVVVLASQMRRIEVFVDDRPQKAYGLSYQTSPSTGLQRLTSVQQFGSDFAWQEGSGRYTGSALPPWQFGYSDAAVSFPGKSDNTDDFDPRLTYADFNGDGRQDVLRTLAHSTNIGTSKDPVRVNECSLHVRISVPGNGFQSAGNPPDRRCDSIEGEDGVPDGNFGFRTGDFDGDGRADIAHVASRQITVSLARWNGSQLSYVERTFGIAGTRHCTGGRDPSCDPWPTVSGRDVALADIDGDGRIEILVTAEKQRGTESDKKKIYYWTGSGFASTGNSSTIPGSVLAVFDLNGNGRAEIYGTRPNVDGGSNAGYRVYEHRSGIRFELQEVDSGVIPSGLSERYAVGDFNGDGTSEYARMKAGGSTGVRIFLSDGRRLVEQSTQDAGGDCAQDGCRLYAGDFDGDGRSDLLVAGLGNEGPFSDERENVGPQTQLLLSRDNNQWSAPQRLDFGRIEAVADFNGDGKADILHDDMSIKYSSGPVPDLLIWTRNPIGGVNGIQYVPSSAWANTNLPFVLQTAVNIWQDPGFPNKPLVAQEPAVLGVEFSVARAVLAQ